MNIFGEKEENKSYIFRPGAYGLIFNEQGDKIALVQTEDGAYFLPGGGIEEGESNEECLLREGLEEIGYLLELVRYIGTSQRYFYSTSDYQHYLSEGRFYLCKIGEQVSDPIEEGHYLRWIEPEAAKDYLFHEHQSWAVGQALTGIFKK